jgi:hypothetical protein
MKRGEVNCIAVLGVSCAHLLINRAQIEFCDISLTGFDGGFSLVELCFGRFNFGAQRFERWILFTDLSRCG